MAVVLDVHKVGAYTNTDLFFNSSGGQKYKMCLSGSKSMC